MNEADINTDQKTAKTDNSEETENKPLTGKGGKNNPGRPKESHRGLADLVTYKDIRDSVRVMKDIVKDKNATAAQKLTAAKFLLSVKLEGLNVKMKQQTAADRKTRVGQNNNSDKGTGKPDHAITINYKDSSKPEDEDNQAQP